MLTAADPATDQMVHSAPLSEAPISTDQLCRIVQNLKKCPKRVTRYSTPDIFLVNLPVSVCLSPAGWFLAFRPVTTTQPVKKKKNGTVPIVHHLSVLVKFTSVSLNSQNWLDSHTLLRAASGQWNPSQCALALCRRVLMSWGQNQTRDHASSCVYGHGKMHVFKPSWV